HALLQVARRRTVTWAVDQRYTDKMAEACVHMHLSVEQASARFLSEMKRHNYTTPTSYLELLNSYEGILKEMDQSIAARHSKLSNGLQTLIRTNSEVEVMQGQLIAIQPRLNQSQKDTVAIMEELSIQQKEVEAKQEVVRAEEAEVSRSADEAEELAQDAQNDLSRALPKYNAAIKAVQSLDKSDISEVKSFARPPELVMFVLQAVCLLFNQPQTWEQAKKLMNAEFLGKLSDYDKDSLDEKMKSKLKALYINSPKFQPEVVESVSKAAKSLCQWVRALYEYSEVAKEVAPKKAKVKESMAKVAQMQEALAAKKFELHEVEDKLAQLKAKYDASVARKAKIEAEMEATRVKLNRAEKLLNGLQGEHERWTQTVQDLDQSRSTLLGDALVATGYVTYLGPFTSEYRKQMAAQWVKYISKKGIPVKTEGEFSLDSSLGNPIQVR
ncbi:MAG: putative dynein heavy chain, partial [Streblomastix strix]